ncbi:MAG: hypothetical protein GF317_14850 [Candidatus Lokiarchaeota archaeon]|nr:hypothetical protein [Candidatus Lokiarchaeota archaeon]MBD3200881.1 hypothetical protein [Candidatus Lokiarchaeota archaeon]
MEIDLLKEKLHKKDKRITPQRMAIYKTLLENKNHPTAEEIHKIVTEQFPNISLATVYQILNMFEEEMSIIKAFTVDHKKHYEINHNFHIHILCPKCENISDVYSDKIEKFWQNLINELKIKPEDQTIKIFEICDDCRKNLKE